jgi:hypothetical protein
MNASLLYCLFPVPHENAGRWIIELQGCVDGVCGHDQLFKGTRAECLAWVASHGIALYFDAGADHA